MYPPVTQFETRTIQILDELSVRAQREAARRRGTDRGLVSADERAGAHRRDALQLRPPVIARLIRAGAKRVAAFLKAETHPPEPVHPNYWP